MNRDTQFAGFAKMLWQELYHEIDWQQDSGEGVEQIIARRAYDLVSHTLLNTGPMMLDCYSHEEQVAAIPDMTTWPERAN